MARSMTHLPSGTRGIVGGACACSTPPTGTSAAPSTGRICWPRRRRSSTSSSRSRAPQQVDGDADRRRRVRPRAAAGRRGAAGERGARAAGRAWRPVVAISGNHDSAPRLGFGAALLARAGVHVRTDAARRSPVRSPLGDGGGVYAIPYLEPDLVREPLGHRGARRRRRSLGAAMARVRADAARRAGRSGRGRWRTRSWPAATPSESERDLGGAAAPRTCRRPCSTASTTSRSATCTVRRSSPAARPLRGSPLAFSFSEAGQAKSVAVVELSAGALPLVELLPCPVPRELANLRGTLDELLADPRWPSCEDAWVQATLTDPVRPADAMERLRRRFPHAVALAFDPQGADAAPAGSYQRLRGLRRRRAGAALRRRHARARGGRRRAGAAARRARPRAAWPSGGASADAAAPPAPHRLPGVRRHARRSTSTRSAEAGLFLLHGDTGAGKTTLLDAVCVRALRPGARARAARDARLRSDHADAATAHRGRAGGDAARAAAADRPRARRRSGRSCAARARRESGHACTRRGARRARRLDRARRPPRRGRRGARRRCSACRASSSARSCCCRRASSRPSCARTAASGRRCSSGSSAPTASRASSTG